MKNKVLLIVLSVIVIGIVGVVIFLALNNNGKFDAITKEMEELKTAIKNADEEKVSDILTRVVSEGDYAEVEKAIKAYYKDYFGVIDSLSENLSKANNVSSSYLITSNYNTDGKEFINTKAALEELKTNLDKDYKTYEEFFTSEEKSMSYIKDKNLGSNFEKYFKAQTKSSEQEKNDSINAMKENIEKAKGKIDATSEIINFLVENASNWHIENDNLMMDTEELVQKYSEMISKLG